MSNPNTNSTSSTAPDSLLRIGSVLALLAISRATWYRGIQAGHYPPPVQIGRRAVGWRQSDIQSFIRSGITAA